MSQVRKANWWRAIDPSFVLGAICTVAFYTIIHQPAMRGSMLHLYTTEHAVEYVIVALFIWGTVDMVLKLLAFPREFVSLRQNWIPSRLGREPVSNAQTLLEQVRERPQWQQKSKIGRRLGRALEYLTENGPLDEYREYVRYLAEDDDHTTHANYMLIRFVIGVSPLLGFLGTVVHFGTALSGISFDELTDRLPLIVSEMGAAFNTTTVALAAAMTMTIALFICERLERNIDRSVDRLVEHELLNRFTIDRTEDPSLVPYLSSVQTAGESVLRIVGDTVHRQTDVWARALDTLCARLDSRHRDDSQGWQVALESLQRRHEELDLQREKLHRDDSKNWQIALETLQRRHEEFDTQREERFRELASLIESRQDQHMARIQETWERAVSLRDDFAELVKTIHELARGEGKLAEVQAVLTDNLRVLRETQQIEDAFHGLTAAIHLLTARHNPTGHGHSAAA